MIKQEAEKRIKKLRAEIARLRKAYHISDDPITSDEVYDSLNKELRLLIKEYPELDDLNAPENRVGGKALDKFEKVSHQIRMLSLNDIFSPEELFDWENRVKKLIPRQYSGEGEVNYFCEVKLDGLAVSLIYENGFLVQGATRGDGLIGENITENLKTIKSIPIQLKKPFPNKIEVRGEAVMAKKTFIALNKKNEREGKPLFANTRNAAAGSLRQLDSKLTAERNLDFFAYDIVQIDGTEELKTHSAKHKLLKKLGFSVDENEVSCKNLNQVLSFIQNFEKKREKFPLGTDGIVISIDDLSIQEILGSVGKAPRYMVAYKYSAEKATTIVKDIKINVGRTGVLTPLAIFQPTLVAGSIVSKATLHNMDQIERLDVRIGDTVVIEKAGDVIPKVVEVLTKLRTGKEKKFKIPEQCPVCGEKVDKKGIGLNKSSSSKGPRISSSTKGGLGQTISQRTFIEANKISVAYYCSNQKCPAKNQRFLEHFVSVFEIYELGPKILRRFQDEGLISDAGDLFYLTKDDFLSLKGLPGRKETFLSGFGEKSAENIIQEINLKKKISFSKFLEALGILHVGEETARDLAQHFENLEELKKASLEEINQIENIGPAVSKSIVNYFKDKNNLDFIKKLLLAGVEIQKTLKQKDGKFKGKTFVLTGTLNTMARELAKEKIMKLGGKISSSVSKNTSFVVAGENFGSKLTEAQKLGVKILSEDDFLKMI